jgi:hypothetical protein
MKKIMQQVLIVICILGAGYLIAYKMFHIPQRLELIFLLVAFLFYPIIRYPMFGVYTFFCISPFIPHIRRLYYLSYERPETDPLIIIGDIILALIFVGLYFEFKQRLPENRRVSSYIRIMLFYICYLFLRTFVLVEIPFASSILIFKNYGPPVLLFLVGIMYADSIRHLKNIWLLTIVIGLVSAVYGIKQLVIGYSQAEEIWFSSINFSTMFIQGRARPFSFFQAPAIFADYMLLAIAAVLMAIDWSRQKTRIIYALFIPLFFYCALITSVRSNWLGIALLLLLWYSLFRVKGKSKRIGALLAIFVVYFSYQMLNDMFGGAFGIDKFFGLATRVSPDQAFVESLVESRTSAITDPFQEHSLLSRMVLWRQLLDTSVWPLYILTGHGTGSLKADSVYFDYLAQFGYPGLIFIVWLFITFIRKGFYIIDNSQNPDYVVLAKGVTVTTIVLATIGTTGTHIHTFPGDAFFWFFNGVLIKQASMTPQLIRKDDSA